MKKSIVLIITTLLVVGAAVAFTGCSGAGSGLKLGFASKTTESQSTDLTDKNGVKSGTAQSDTIMCSVLVDNAGKVNKIFIDRVWAPITFDDTGKIITPKGTAFPSRRALGDQFGMKKASPIGREWYEQADAIQTWMTGKTADQIKNMKTKTDANGKATSAEPDLTSSATVSISEFIEVAVAAINNAK